MVTHMAQTSSSTATLPHMDSVLASIIPNQLPSAFAQVFGDRDYACDQDNPLIRSLRRVRVC